MSDAPKTLAVEGLGDVEPAPTAEHRPWHGSPNVFDSIYQHFTAELALLKEQIAELEKRLTKKA